MVKRDRLIFRRGSGRFIGLFRNGTSRSSINDFLIVLIVFNRSSSMSVVNVLFSWSAIGSAIED